MLSKRNIKYLSLALTVRKGDFSTANSIRLYRQNKSELVSKTVATQHAAE